MHLSKAAFSQVRDSCNVESSAAVVIQEFVRKRLCKSTVTGAACSAKTTSEEVRSNNEGKCPKRDEVVGDCVCSEVYCGVCLCVAVHCQCSQAHICIIARVFSVDSKR